MIAVRTRLTLYPVPPFRLDLTVWALRRRPTNVVDRWDGTAYRRVLAVEGVPVSVSVTQEGPMEAPVLQVDVKAPRPAPVEGHLPALLERTLGLGVSLEGFYAAASRDRRLGPLVARFRGLKPPRFPSVFECLVNGFACQQVTLALGIVLLNRLACRFGRRVRGEAAGAAFPEPRDLLLARVTDLRALGFSRQKARAILELSQEVASGRVDLEGLAALDDAAAVELLRAIRGVGRWTAEYVLLRGLGRVHVFPADDVGARRTLQRFLALRRPLDYDAVGRVLSRWAPYAGLVYLHLLLEGLERAGTAIGSSLKDAPSSG